MKILAVGAHLDDIELACGGTILKALENGHHVKMIVMSKSGYKNYDGKIMRTNDVAIAEGHEAAKVLGVDDFEILEFNNKDINYCSTTIEPLDMRIQEYKPDVIFTHWPFDTHQAHVGTAKSTITAARRYNTIFLYEPIAPSGRSYVAFRPQAYVDISSHIEKKIAALMKHETEYKKFGKEWIDGVKARAAYRGYEMGVQYGEAFETLRCELSFRGESII